ncbi:Pyridine nucleotide-disulfide oxidoreductase family protein [Stanieria cyanosphaera PCC 7437]|uniref:Pyridine nucleotide-disulfide oxidoreductase family protein n=1 Tax=Stanieria cyanosphaera (strain ATCC 29371 / PCC 7437) TaxID=111780 RepID=K9XY10_STAC7|nr:FAD-dependent oxidoreductase [Stanieria cyanosphaera]AFZ36542.1 Pyridine nucleotide-disulfide oxidoreductase family protein [Stanieria cyanosphaera PCC 7437]
MTQNLVLIGGGHSHAIALKLFEQNPISGVKLTLISDVKQTPYSGMLPGHVAGFYSYQETHINLQHLSELAEADLIIDQAVGLDLDQKQVICLENPPIKFDYLSIDIGSTPQTNNILGAKKYVIPAKPVPQFLQAWEELLTTHPNNSISLAIVGGGAGGVELALNMQARLLKEQNNQTTIHLFHREEKLLSSHNDWVSNRLKKILIARGIKLHLQENVKEVLAHQIICDSGLVVDCNYIFWVTQASAPTWIKNSGLTTDQKGFILVKDTLQSVSHPHIFATGDVATMQNYQRPKAGVFAVRQGRPLFENWRRIILKRPLKTYTPQKNYLALIGTGDKNAIASWGLIGWQSPLLWYLKDYIDRKFMNRFLETRKR